MSKFTVVEYMNPAGDVDCIEVDLTWSAADIVALLSFVRSCVEVIELYLEAVNNGYIEDVAEINLTVLKDAIETFESEED